MRTIWLAGMVGVVSVVSTAYGHADEVNFAQVNPVLASLAQAVVAGDDTVDFALPAFDEAFSSLKLGRLKLDLQGSFSKAPWGGKGELAASSTYVIDRTPTHLGIQAGLVADLKTDVLALARHAGAIALAQSKGHSHQFETRILQLLGALSKVSSLDGLATLIESGQALGIEMLAAKVAEPGAQAEWSQVRAAYQQATVQRFPDRITIETPDASQFFAHRPDFRFRAGISILTLAPERAKADLEVFVTATQAQLDKLQTALGTHLAGAQAGDPVSTGKIQDGFRQALIAFKRVIKGENSY